MSCCNRRSHRSPAEQLEKSLGGNKDLEQPKKQINKIKKKKKRQNPALEKFRIREHRIFLVLKGTRVIEQTVKSVLFVFLAP